jgi:hypothetical protein
MPGAIGFMKLCAQLMLSAYRPLPVEKTPPVLAVFAGNSALTATGFSGF